MLPRSVMFFINAITSVTVSLVSLIIRIHSSANNLKSKFRKGVDIVVDFWYSKKLMFYHLNAMHYVIIGNTQ